PTETEEGEITYTCKRDPSHTKTEAVPATGPMNPSLKLTLSADYKFGYMWSYYEYYLGVRLNETLTNTGDVPLRVVTSNVKEFGDTMKEGFFINILKPNEQISFSSYHTLQGIWFEMPNGSGYDTGDITFDKITYTPADPKYTGYAALDVYHYGWPTQGNSVDSSKVEPLCKSNTESITVRLPRDGYVEELHGLGVMKTEKSRPANGEYYVPGETIDYVITLTNDSGSSLSNVAVFDSLAGFEPIAAGESLAAGEMKQFGYSTVVTEDETSRGTAVNGAVITFSYGNGISAMPRFSNRVYSKAGDPDAPVTVCFDKTKLDAEITLSAEAEEAAQNEQWHEAAEKWNAEVEKLYKLLWEAGDDEARCAVLEERAMFYSSLEALDDKDYENAALRDMLCGVLFKRLAQTAATEVPEVAGEKITLSSSYPDLLEDEPGMELIFGKLKDKHALLSALILAVR
ncbi:MAG: DUF11 domain-containing protein, partial [Clostridia bacterium]|nr:DUF11 domain-containing protein [Clostridia bacterium]